jgi:TP901 family phage tail tape measure protein
MAFGDRTVAVRLKADISDLRSSMAQAKREVTGFASTVTNSARTNRAAWDQAGLVMTGFGAAAAGGLLMATKAAISWESAWTGVTKTVEGSPAQLQRVEDGLRGLAKSLPLAHREIAAVAEAAGQLGIQTDSVVGFTKVMIDLGETTNLSADEAATSIAQMMNVMQTAPEDVGRLGATLVALGNDGASTEKQIIEMSQRIAGAAAVVGLSEGEVLAFANTIASMGIEVEAGGTSVSKVLRTMSKSAQSGGAELEVFAETAGMSASEFATAFREDPAEAFATFIDGLGGVQEAGGNVFAILEDLGLSEERVTATLLGMTSSGDLLRDSLDLQAVAWAQNTALVEEAAKRYDTTEAKLAIAKNSINDAAITIGEAFLPAVAGAAEAVADFAGWVGELPTPVLAAAGGLTGVAGAASLAGGAFLLIFPRVMDTVSAFQTLRTDMPGVATGLGRVGKAVGALAVIGTVAVALDALSTAAAGAPPRIEDTTRALIGLANGADAARVLDGIFKNNRGSVDSFTEALGRLQDKNAAATIFDPIVGAMGIGTVKFKQASQSINAIDQSLANMVQSGNIDLASQSYAGLAEQAIAAGYSFDDVNAVLPLFNEAMRAVQGEADLTAVSTGNTGAAVGEMNARLGEVPAAGQAATDSIAFVGSTLGMTEDQIESAVEKIEDWREELQSIGTAFVEPLALYTEQLQAKTDAEQAQAEASAETQNLAIDDQIEALRRRTDAELSAVDSSAVNAAAQRQVIEDRRDDEIDALEAQKLGWEDYVKGVSLSLDEYAKALEDQIAAQDDWRENIIAVTQRGGLEVGQILAAMGAEGAQITADMADATDREFNRLSKAMVEDARRGGSDAAAALDAEMRVMAEVGKAGGRKTAQEIADQLGIGVDEVIRIANLYGKNLAAGINPLLSGLGEKVIYVSDSKFVRAKAEGGIEDHTAQIAPAGAMRLWAEPETGGESYIPLAPAKRARSTDIWRETGRRLGMRFEEFASGGFYAPDDVPHPPSTSPYRIPISTAADATMRRGYEEVLAEVREQMEPPGGGSATGLLPIMAAARRYVQDTYGVQNIGGFARRNIAGTSKLSDHALGKAIDVMTSNLRTGWAIANDFAFGEAGKRYRAENVIWQQSISSRGRPFRGMADRGSPTQNHRDHVHIDTYRDGGIRLPKGTPFNPWLRDAGGPLLPGWTLNATGRPETVIPHTIDPVNTIRFADGGFTSGAARTGTVALSTADRELLRAAAGMHLSMQVSGAQSPVETAHAAVDMVMHEARKIRRGGVNARR